MGTLLAMRKLLIALVVLAVLAVGGDYAAARLFESRVTTILEQRYDLGTRPIVQVRDFPFLPHLLSGNFSAIDLAAKEVRAEGITAQALELHLRGVHVPRKVLLGGSGDVRVDHADGEVTLSEAEVNRLLAAELPQPLTLSFQPDEVRARARVTVLGQAVDALVTGRLGVSAGRLTFTPTHVEAAGLPSALLSRVAGLVAFQVSLRLPAGIQLERVNTEQGAVVVTGQAASLQVPS